MLERINKENDIKQIPEAMLPVLADEIRDFLIENLSKTGGHLASNLGSVELTMALHLVLNLPTDKLIFDVGHQAYTHKILTGRKDGFLKLRQEGGLSGFPRLSESKCDSFDTGHASTSLSAGIGYVKARELSDADYKVISVIGDGALTGGLAYEALNNAAELKSNYTIVLNDNEMSISPNVGGISRALTEMRTSTSYTDFKEGIQTTLEKIPGIGKGMVNTLKKTKSSIKQLVIPGMLFENLGLMYLGPIDGHDVKALVKVIREALRFEGAVIVHVLTKKGKGYAPALRHPSRFHGTSPFDIETGLPAKKSAPTWTDIFSTVMRKMGDREPEVVAITAAMREGVGLKRFANMFPERFFDVGIAEEHAVTFAAGLALGGKIPVVAIYSSFLQRAFDQVMEDVCMQNLHVIFAIDRAGLVGSDGRTHQGVFDLSYLGVLPGITILAPKNKWELSDMMKFAVRYDGPIAVRYPRGEACIEMEEYRAPIEYGRAEVIREGSGLAILAVGSQVAAAMHTADRLSESGLQATVVNMRFIKPLDKRCLIKLAKTHDTFVTLEENAKIGGFGEQVLSYVNEERLGIYVKIIALGDAYIHHGSVDYQKKLTGLDEDTIYMEVKKLYSNEEEQ